MMILRELVCKVVGHKPPTYAKKGWYSPGEEYAEVILGPIDGTGLRHATVYGTCARCESCFRLARIHLPKHY